MYKIEILTIGKNKECWLKEALQEYEQRLINTFNFTWTFVKDIDQLTAYCQKNPYYICLDACGSMMTSIQLSTKLFNWLEKLGSKITFVIGGPEGLSKEIKNKAYHTVSFSSLIFTHQMIRLLLVEQIYRADQIRKNTSYHK